MGTDADTLNSPSKMLRQEVPYCTHPNISGLEANMSQDRARCGHQVSEGILLLSYFQKSVQLIESGIEKEGE